ncbi:MAG: hypothetical protein U0166_20185 [Acidobacteriota bacterium]
MALGAARAVLLKLGSPAAKAGAGGGVASAFWTFPAVLGSAVVIAWGAEAAQFLVSQGLALAILAWLQTLPEFAVEAVIALEAGRDPAKIHLATANFTGSLRLLVGLGWPMIYAVAAIAHRRRGRGPLREIVLDGGNAVEVVGLLPCLLYFCYVLFKGSLTVWDSLWLSLIYLVYLWLLNRMPPEEEEAAEDIPAVPRAILRQRPRVRNACIVGLFVLGGAALFVAAHPFLESMLAMAVVLGISQYVFIQWIAPFLSEFPEYVSALKWSAHKRAPMALMNMISSNINQWTVLAAMIPLCYSYAKGAATPLMLDAAQESEIGLTLAQSFLGFVLLANMRFAWHEALALFLLWGAQFAVADIRREVAVVYLAWSVVLLASVAVRRRSLECLPAFRALWRAHVLQRPEGTPR